MNGRKRQHGFVLVVALLLIALSGLLLVATARKSLMAAANSIEKQRLLQREAELAVRGVHQCIRTRLDLRCPAIAKRRRKR